MDTCPICAKLAEKKILEQGKYCSKLHISNKLLVALNMHGIVASIDALEEAYSFVNTGTGKVYIGDYEECPGHWAISIIRLSSEFPEGKAVHRKR